jgi:hypothetical protein
MQTDVDGQSSENSRVARISGGAELRGTATKPRTAKKRSALVVRR